MSYLYYSFLHRKKYIPMYLVHLKSWDILQLTCEIFLYTRNDLKRPSSRQNPISEVTIYTELDLREVI